jgi:hypothetical protein
LNLACTHGATLAGGVLTVNSPTIVASTAVATKLMVQAKAKPKNKHAITIEAWVKPKNINPTQSLPARIVTLSTDQHNRNFTLGQENGTYVVRLRTKSDDLNGSNNAFSAGVVATNRVSHLVYTWSATSQIARFYQDGVEVGKKTGVSGDFSVWNDNYKLAIANEFNNQPRAWLGEVHLVAIYNTALTSDEVSQNFAAGPATQ